MSDDNYEPKARELAVRAYVLMPESEDAIVGIIAAALREAYRQGRNDGVAEFAEFRSLFAKES